MKRAVFIFAGLLWTALLITGCGGKKEDPILRLSAAEALKLGQDYLAEKKYYRASQYLTHAFEVEPNSRSGRTALLLAADALFLNGGTDNYIRCEAKYRDFLNRFPTSDKADYAQYRVAECLARRTERPDRDQTVTRKALGSFQELLRLYPTSPYVPKTRQRIVEVTNLLAAHELSVAHFYMRYGDGRLCGGAINRLEHLMKEYPSFAMMDAALFHLAVSYEKCQRMELAEQTFADLESRYPESEFAAAARKGVRKAMKIGELQRLVKPKKRRKGQEEEG